ncbi:UNVERIFIED_CONTAM: hypothetical protein GTU68_023632 [Idotea baltica]|nr:hypothetical protein [Idotea baltica]
MLVDTVIEDSRWLDIDLSKLAEKAARATLLHLAAAPGDFEISLLGCNDARIASLNTEFREKAQPTNVLSWPSAERAAAAGELGDIAISYETCRKEASEAGVKIEDHITHLIVHAVLHLLGYDHEDDADATLMESLEISVLADLGISDPYRHAGR